MGRTETHLHFPLDQVVFTTVAMHTKEHKLFTLLVVAVIIAQNLKGLGTVAFEQNTLIISLTMSFGSIELVVFIDHVNLKNGKNSSKWKMYLSERGFPFDL